nr:MAG TPA: tail protein [Caudoviricetes sp.]
MFRLTAKIEIQSAKKWVFDKVASVEITRDIDTLTDTCVLQLPKKITWQGSDVLPIKRGDGVTVWLGYDDHLQFAFRGFVTTIGLKTPLSISCEDYLFKLKQQEAKKKVYKSATIDQILRDQNLGIKHKVFGEQSIGQYRVTADTVSALLGHLKDQGGIRSFIRIENNEPVLYCGVLFEQSSTPHRGVYATGLNIIDDTQLKVQSAADMKLKVKAISLLPDNKKIRVEVGDADGETRTLHTYNKPEKELKAWAEQELKRLKRDGLTGSFTTFGAELADKLDHIGIKIDGERKGVYQVQKNVIKYSPEGFRQEITIGARVAE